MVDSTQKATATDEYATRHNPFVYFHSIIDDTDAVRHARGQPRHAAARTSPRRADTPNYVFITPDLCDDGHDAPCANGPARRPRRRPTAFLRQWVPAITGSPAFRNQNGLLIITFDEADTDDASSCCGEIPGPGVAASRASPGSAAATSARCCCRPASRRGRSRSTPYNHYTMLRSVEDIFGAPAPRLRRPLGRAVVRLRRVHAQLSAGGRQTRRRRCVSRRPRSPRAPRASRGSRCRGARSDAGAAQLHRPGAVRVRAPGGRCWPPRPAARSSFAGQRGHRRIDFRVRGTSASGLAGAFATATTVTPTGVHPKGAHYTGALARFQGPRAPGRATRSRSSKPSSKLTLQIHRRRARDHRRPRAQGRPEHADHVRRHSRAPINLHAARRADTAGHLPPRRQRREPTG